MNTKTSSILLYLGLLETLSFKFSNSNDSYMNFNSAYRYYINVTIKGHWIG